MPKGRKPKNIEFINTLMSIFGFEKVSAFAKACGKKTPNMARYLKGTLPPGKSVLRTSVEHLAEWAVQPDLELAKLPKKLSSLSKEPGIYIFFSSSGQILYIGQATNLQSEIRQTLGRHIATPIRFAPHLNAKTRPQLKAITTYLSTYIIHSERLRHNLEALLLRVAANQSHNTNFGSFK